MILYSPELNKIIEEYVVILIGSMDDYEYWQFTKYDAKARFYYIGEL